MIVSITRGVAWSVESGYGCVFTIDARPQETIMRMIRNAARPPSSSDAVRRAPLAPKKCGWCARCERYVNYCPCGKKATTEEL